MVSPRVLSALLALLCTFSFAPVLAQSPIPDQSPTIEVDIEEASPSDEAKVTTTIIDPANLLASPQDLLKPEQLGSTMQVMLMLSALSLAPAILLMTTSFVRVIVVLGLLRQALGAQQLPPSQVITSIALFVTLLVMAPVWKQAYEQGIKPYSDGKIGLEEAFAETTEPLRRFMADQIQRTGNDDDVHMFLAYLPDEANSDAEYAYYDPTESERLVPLSALLPAFMLSELKTAFLIGFQIYLPFVVLDLVVASVTISMGMLMLPPVLISLPFKLMLFVLVDGWRLVIGMLLESFELYSVT